jgi:riboflavin synthase
MFTGIITHTGVVSRIEKKGDWLFTIAAENFAADAAIGASICHNGACLTVLKTRPKEFIVQVSKETLDNTTLGSWKKGTRINLERALKVGDELGGHFVTGHVDATAPLKKKKKLQDSWKLTFAIPKRLGRFIAKKGSVTLDGVALTVNEVTDKHFAVNIIPHTWANTTLSDREIGDRVNLEIDLIARTLSRLKGK